MFPLVSLITHDASWVQLYIFFWSAHFAAALLTTVLTLYHANLVLHGKTTHENNARKGAYYNLGWRQNLLEVKLVCTAKLYTFHFKQRMF